VAPKEALNGAVVLAFMRPVRACTGSGEGDVLVCGQEAVSFSPSRHSLGRLTTLPDALARQNQLHL
jgi:hypothetical protein